MEQKLYKTTSPSLFWEVRVNIHGNHYVLSTPFCSNESCRVPLDQANLRESDTGQHIRGWRCANCGKEYECPGNNYMSFVELIQKRYEGYIRQNRPIVSLDLVPTQVTHKAEDENYWVEARIGEKNGKRQAVVYFGEKIRGEQSKKDYVQVFVDLEDAQIRFDKTNKNPMKLLCVLTAEFEESQTLLKRKK